MLKQPSQLQKFIKKYVKNEFFYCFVDEFINVRSVLKHDRTITMLYQHEYYVNTNTFTVIQKQSSMCLFIVTKYILYY